MIWTLLLVVLCGTASSLHAPNKFDATNSIESEEVYEHRKEDGRRRLAGEASDSGKIIPPAWTYLELTPTKDRGDSLHYMASIWVSGQKLNLIIDTGSADLLALSYLYCQIFETHVAGACFNDDIDGGATNSYSSWSLIIDDEDVRDSHVRKHIGPVMADVSVLGSTLTDEWLVSPLTFLVSRKLGFQVSNNNRGRHRFPDNDGVLGLAYPSLTMDKRISPFHQLLQQGQHPSFSLDLRPPGQSSKLWLGGMDETYRDRLQWGAPETSSGYLEGRIYNLQICGTPLDVYPEGSSSSSSSSSSRALPVSALIDTGSSCLNVHEAIFDQVVRRLPVRCVARSFVNDLRCYLSTDADEDNLPSISFSLQEDSSELLHINIKDLVVATPWLGSRLQKELCLVKIVPVKSMGQQESAVTMLLGNRALRSLYTVFDLENGRIGAANKHDAPPPSQAECVPLLQCKGMQAVDSALNICQDPDCTPFYYLSLDEDTKTCRLPPQFHAVLATIVVFVLTCECALHELQAWLGRKALAQLPENGGPAGLS